MTERGEPWRTVTVADTAFQDAIDQLGADRATDFVERDLQRVVDFLGFSSTLDALEQGPWPGGRLAVSDAITVGAFSAFVAFDDQGGVVVYALDIWPDGWPD